MNDKYLACAAQHFGPWLIEPAWFNNAISAVKAGTYPRADVAGESTEDEERDYELTDSGIALIRIDGQITKGRSSYGGASSVALRQTIRSAVQDKMAKAIMLVIDSPGGTVAGTPELAADVASAAKNKPLHAFIEDLGASAAYWVASQASRVSANSTAEVGSIGTVAIVEDSSGMYEKAGIKVHVISTGDFKGAFAPGTEVTDEHLAYMQDRVDEINEHFLKGIAAGRANLRLDQVRKLADGKVYIASKAQDHGLIDAVETFDQAMASLLREVRKLGVQSRKSREAALHSQKLRTLAD